MRPVRNPSGQRLTRGLTIKFDRQLLIDAKRAARLVTEREERRLTVAELVRRSLRKEVKLVFSTQPDPEPMTAA